MDEMYEHNRMPHSHEAEQSVLGAIFLDPELMSSTQEILLPESFYRGAHQHIFRAMMDLNEDGKDIDIVTVLDRLTQEGVVNEAGGPQYLAEITSNVPTTRNIQYYTDVVFKNAVKRKLIHTADSIANDGYNDELDLDTVLNDAERRILELSSTRESDGFKDIRDVLGQVYDNAEQLDQNSGQTPGIPTGYRDLDQMTAGFNRNDLIILAARPSVGKTAFALNIAQKVATHEDQYTVGIFSLEMGADQLATRMICSSGNVDSNRLRTGTMTEEDWNRFTVAVGKLSRTKIFIDDTPGVRITDIRSKCRRLKQEHGLDMIVIDYLQLIQGSGSRASDNRQQEVSEISRMLKAIARELECPVIALSQLSRGVEQRQDKRPMMSDIRESGSIEQDADIVAFLYRDDYYNRGDGDDDDDDDGGFEPQTNDENGEIEIIIAKQRNGPTGTVKLHFMKQYNKFTDIDYAHADMG
ncbi:MULTISPECIES: replicative DNA helicase [Staphylococcus intermedius group]|uniref:replicative DNA helicase n=1 Tax=Staphylococcus intermedius group TaxID=2815305 RepID=UPI00111DA624|nr:MULTISPECIES: replicative DNA helicase [Staphylococcus intermedius group]EGQ4176949.1 replicative DNA helicase [Staphylococcus pseudintermedius]EHT6206935.1 replicative DNA helicase [Staphylococcus pseudintermedius]EJD8483471.1 replicative DNA helicase [Staphylococcus pseudintermedius]EJD8515643.1 replicative DNA helicase [Staphylococcus pseudintermedius]EKO0722058.1 replicative DNA helicase [Staphylococcus pseudintermedius]